MKYSELIKRRGLIRISPQLMEELNLDEFSADLGNIGCTILLVSHDMFRNNYNMWVCHRDFVYVPDGSEAPEYTIICEKYENSIPNRIIRIQL